MEADLTTGVSVDGAGWEFGFRFGGVAGGVGSGGQRGQRGQRLQHAQQAVGGGQLQVFLRDVAHLSATVSGLETQTQTMTTAKNVSTGKLLMRKNKVRCKE